MYDVFMVIVSILRVFFILYGNTASHLETDGFPFISSCSEGYILEICTEFHGIPFHNNDTLLVNVPDLLARIQLQYRSMDPD